jgi:hypothetical protein
MTPATDARNVAVMKNARCSPGILVPLAFGAAISLGLGRLTDLGVRLLGSGPISTAALAGNVAGLAACVLSVWFGARRISRSRAC